MKKAVIGSALLHYALSVTILCNLSLSPLKNEGTDLFFNQCQANEEEYTPHLFVIEAAGKKKKNPKRVVPNTLFSLYPPSPRIGNSFLHHLTVPDILHFQHEEEKYHATTHYFTRKTNPHDLVICTPLECRTYPHHFSSYNICSLSPSDKDKCECGYPHPIDYYSLNGGVIAVCFLDGLSSFEFRPETLLYFSLHQISQLAEYHYNLMQFQIKKINKTRFQHFDPLTGQLISLSPKAHHHKQHEWSSAQSAEQSPRAERQRQQSPRVGQQSPRVGQQSPRVGQQSPRTGRQREQSPRGERQGEQSPREKILSYDEAIMVSYGEQKPISEEPQVFLYDLSRHVGKDSSSFSLSHNFFSTTQIPESLYAVRTERNLYLFNHSPSETRLSSSAGETVEETRRETRDETKREVGDETIRETRDETRRVTGDDTREEGRGKIVMSEGEEALFPFEKSKEKKEGKRITIQSFYNKEQSLFTASYGELLSYGDIDSSLLLQEKEKSHHLNGTGSLLEHYEELHERKETALLENDVEKNISLLKRVPLEERAEYQERMKTTVKKARTAIENALFQEVMEVVEEALLESPVLDESETRDKLMRELGLGVTRQLDRLEDLMALEREFEKEKEESGENPVREKSGERMVLMAKKAVSERMRELYEKKKEHLVRKSVLYSKWTCERSWRLMLETGSRGRCLERMETWEDLEEEESEEVVMEKDEEKLMEVKEEEKKEKKRWSRLTVSITGGVIVVVLIAVVFAIHKSSTGEDFLLRKEDSVETVV